MSPVINIKVSSCYISALDMVKIIAPRIVPYADSWLLVSFTLGSHCLCLMTLRIYIDHCGESHLLMRKVDFSCCCIRISLKVK
jgi:hypothetical protein